MEPILPIILIFITIVIGYVSLCCIRWTYGNMFLSWCIFVILILAGAPWYIWLAAVLAVASLFA